MKDIRALLMIGGLSAAAVLGQALPAAASHESSNHLTFAPVVGSSTPSASGQGEINYVKGASGDKPDTQWTSSFRFSGLTSGTTYTVGVKGRFADATAFSGLCSFTANASGTGTCTNRFTGLQRLAVAQLRVGGNTGAAVLQATRQAVLSGPGSIESSGGCREPDQMGSTCAAPGRV